MRNQFLLFITILSFSIIFAASCGGGAANQTTTTNNAANTNAANTANTAAANNANSAIATTRKTETETTNNAPTLAPVVTAYYEALKKKDDSALRKVFSQKTLKDWEADMKEEKKTSLADWMTSNEQVPEKAFEVRNEKIEGETGVAEIRGGSYAVWTPFKFVRENGEWKMTNESPDFDAVKKAASDANTAK
jgi:hypothetical protein